MTSFSQRISSIRKCQNIYLVRGGKDDTKQDTWFFIRVENLKINLFLKEIKNGVIDLQEFGEILESGYGQEPPEYIFTKMHEKYGFKL
jgi:hypothetical protein